MNFKPTKTTLALLTTGFVLSSCSLYDDISAEQTEKAEQTEQTEQTNIPKETIEQDNNNPEKETITQQVTGTLFDEEVTFNVNYTIKRDAKGGFSSIVPLSVNVELTPETDLADYHLTAQHIKGNVTITSGTLQYNGIEVASFEQSLNDTLLTQNHGINSYVDTKPVYHDKQHDLQRFTQQMYHLIRGHARFDGGLATMLSDITGDNVEEMKEAIEGGKISVTWDLVAEQKETNDRYQLLIHDELIVDD